MTLEYAPGTEVDVGPPVFPLNTVPAGLFLVIADVPTPLIVDHVRSTEHDPVLTLIIQLDADEVNDPDITLQFPFVYVPLNVPLVQVLVCATQLEGETTYDVWYDEVDWPLAIDPPHGRAHEEADGVQVGGSLAPLLQILLVHPPFPHT